MLLETAIMAFVLTSIPQTKMEPLPPQLQLHTVERNIVLRTNRERRRHGLRPLLVDERLVRSARRHSIWMSSTGNFRHTSDPVAENIAMGQANSTGALNAWMNSSGHRANILNSGYRRIGVAAYRSRSGSIYWVQQFLR